MILPAYINSNIPKNVTMNAVSNFIYKVSDDSVHQKDLESKTKKSFLLICGLSGAGKTAICNEILCRNSSFEKVKTSTTRPRRQDESEIDDPYYRFNLAEFQETLSKGLVVEFTEYAGNFYFTRKDSISRIIDAGKNPMIVIDPKGSNFYKKRWNEGDLLLSELNLIRLFVVPPSLENLRERLINRSDAPEIADARITQSLEDVKHIWETDYVVINETEKLNEVVAEVLNLLD